MDRRNRDIEYFRGAGHWAYVEQGQDPSSQWGSYNSDMAINTPMRNFGSYNQQYNQPAAPMNTYATSSYQNDNISSYYAPQSAVPTSHQPSYADVARIQPQAGVDSRRRNSQYDTSSRRPAQTERGAHQCRAQGQSQAGQVPMNTLTQPNVPLVPRTPSYAEVAAVNLPNTFSANATPRARPARPFQSTSSGPQRPTQSPDVRYYTPQQSISPEAQAQSSANNVDPGYDFTLLLDMDLMDWLEQPRVVEERSGLLADNSAATMRSQYTRPRAGSATASSTHSSGRRSRREIMAGTAQYRCQLCGGGFRTSEDQRKHELRVHRDVAARPYACYCGKRFDYPKDLNRHLATHGPRTPTVWCPFPDCEYATKGFPRKDHLDRHMLTHYKADSAIQMSRSTSSYSNQ